MLRHQAPVDPIGFDGSDEFASYDWGIGPSASTCLVHPMNAWTGIRSWNIRPSRTQALRWYASSHWGAMLTGEDPAWMHADQAAGAVRRGWNASGWTPGDGARVAPAPAAGLGSRAA